MIQAKDDGQSPFSLPAFNAMVVGEGAIGTALADALLAGDSLQQLVVLRRSEGGGRSDPRVRHLSFDAESGEGPPAADTLGLDRLHLVINTIGILHGQGLMPEKRLRDLAPQNLLKSFAVNAMVLPQLAQAYGPLLRHSEPALLASLSARVGSIEDNQLGGWYSYRASKAAHNMLLRTLAREWRVSHRNVTIAALHPGTVQSPLSDPFVTAAYSNRVLEPAECAGALLEVMASLGPGDSGSFFDWRGESIPW